VSQEESGFCCFNHSSSFVRDCAYGYIVEILWHLREPSLKKEKTNKKMVKTQIMKKTLGTMVAIMAVAISIGTLITAKYATAGETVRDGRFIAYDNGTVLDTSTNLMWAAKDNGKLYRLAQSQ